MRSNIPPTFLHPVDPIRLVGWHFFRNSFFGVVSERPNSQKQQQQQQQHQSNKFDRGVSLIDCVVNRTDYCVVCDIIIVVPFSDN
jgi:hypothetical protein